MNLQTDLDILNEFLIKLGTAKISFRRKLVILLKYIEKNVHEINK